MHFKEFQEQGVFCQGVSGTEVVKQQFLQLKFAYKWFVLL